MVRAVRGPPCSPFRRRSSPSPKGDKAKWPDDIHIPVGDKQAVLKRYNTGNPISEDGLFWHSGRSRDPQAAVCHDQRGHVQLRRELGDSGRRPAR